MLRRSKRGLTRALWLLAALASVVSQSCSGDGQLLIMLERPSDSALDPLADPRLTKLSLRVSQNGGLLTEQDTFIEDRQKLQVGQVPVGAPFDLRLVGQSATDEMLGLGLVMDVAVDADSETSVAVKFRKPMGYVVGERGALAVSTMAEDAASAQLLAPPLEGASLVAAAPNGVFLLAAKDSSLLALRTGDHQLLLPTQLPSAATCLGVSSDSLKALACHRGQRQLSIVDLEQIGSGQETVRTVDLEGEPAKVAFSSGKRDNAWVIVDGLGPEEICDGRQSMLYQVQLSTGQVTKKVALGRPAADLAVDPRDESLFLTLPCEGEGALGHLSGSALQVLVRQSGLRHLSQVGKSLFLVSPGAGGEGLVVRYELPNQGDPVEAMRKSFSLSPLAVTVGSQPNSAGALVWVSLPQQLVIHQVAVAPDGQRALVLFTSHFVSDIQLFQCSYQTDLELTGVLLLDLPLGETLLYRFSQLRVDSCFSNCLSEAGSGSPLTDPAVCERAFRDNLKASGLLLDPEYQPQDCAVLFGG